MLITTTFPNFIIPYYNKKYYKTLEKLSYIIKKDLSKTKNYGKLLKNKKVRVSLNIEIYE